MDCYTPYPVEEAAEAIGFHRDEVSLVTLIGGLLGLAAMFGLETWIAVWAYPLNIAGRPYFSWPAFVVPAYEWTILWAGLSAAFGMLALCGLAEAVSPGIQRAEFSQRSDDRQVLFVSGVDGSRSSIAAEARSFLEAQSPVSVVEVEY